MIPTRVALERILCPVDLSDSSERTLKRAVALASWFEARVTALHAIRSMPWAGGGGDIGMPADLLRRRREDAACELNALVAPLLFEGVPIEVRIVEGDPAVTIREVAEALPADLLIMGTHDRSGFERLLLGSVGERVLRTAPCPVLTLGGEPRPAFGGPLFRRIICAADLTNDSERTMNLALSLAEENLAQVTLLHVVEGALGETGPHLYRPVPELAPLRSVLVDRAMERLLGAAAAAHSFCEVSVRVETGSAWRQIVHVATETHADVVVIGAHPHGRVGRLFQGSTATQVVRHAPCPVLTVGDALSPERWHAAATALGGVPAHPR